MVLEHTVRRYPVGVGLWEHAFRFQRWTFKDLSASEVPDAELERRALRAIVREMEKEEHYGDSRRNR